MGGGRKKRITTNHQERLTARLIDDISDFEDFKAEILPKIRAMLKRGAKPEEILEFAQSHAAARLVTIALTDPDSGKAYTASKDVLDRQMGKAKERTEVEHKFTKLKDEELDSLLLSQADAVSDDEATDDTH